MLFALHKRRVIIISTFGIRCSSFDLIIGFFFLLFYHLVSFIARSDHQILINYLV